MTNRPDTGWALVPRNATAEMVEAAEVRNDNEPLTDWGKSCPAPFHAIHDALVSAAPSPLDDAELVERVAKAIFETTDFGAPACVSWVERGNSFAQDEARSYARAAITAIITPKEG